MSNPGTKALEQLTEMGLFAKSNRISATRTQYWATNKPVSQKQWANAAGLVHVAASWIGKGISVMRGRNASDVIYIVDSEAA